MKKAVFIIGLISAFIFMIGAAFKTLHYPGAAIIITTGASLGSLFLILYISTGIKSLSGKIEKVNAVSLAITMIFVLVSFTFKTLHLPGAGYLLISTYLAWFIATIILYIDAFSEKESSRKSLKMIFAFALFIFMVTSVFLYFYIRSLTS